MFCKYHKIAASPTASNTLWRLPATLNARFIRSYKTYDSSSTKMEYKKKAFTLSDRTLNILGQNKNTYFSLCRVSWKRAANVKPKDLRLNKRTSDTAENLSEFSWALSQSAWRSNSPRLQNKNDKLIIYVSQGTNMAIVCKESTLDLTIYDSLVLGSSDKRDWLL